MSAKTVTRRRQFRSRCRSAGVVLVSCLYLMGCAGDGLATEAVYEPAVSAGQILSPSGMIASAPLYSAPGPAFSVPGMPVAPSRGAHAFLNLLAPGAVAVRNHSIYLADIGYLRLFRYDMAHMALSRFSDYVSGTISAMAVAPDMTLYVADVNAGRVLHFSVEGKLLQIFTSAAAMARPVGIVLDEANGRVLVADNLYKHVIIFNSLGQPMGTIKSERARSVDSLAAGPDGLYLVDRLAHEVLVMGYDGADRYTLGAGVLKDPLTVAVDRFNRIFVTDASDDSIKIFEGDELLSSYGRSGGGPGSFNRVTSLCIDHDILYAADSLNRRIQTFRIAPPGLGALPNE